MRRSKLLILMYHKLQEVLHRRWCEKLRKRLRNQNPTIITNNCCGGFIYHDLGLKFNSPTINLTVQNYPLFLEHLEHYLSCNLVETNCGRYSFPTGKLISGEFPDINLLFNHYRSFGEAQEKWMQRVKRVNYENIFFIMECYDNVYPEELESYKRLPYAKNKVVLTHSIHPEMSDAHYISSEKNNKFAWGRTFKQRPFSGKRYLDDFDYVSFLNGDV